MKYRINMVSTAEKVKGQGVGAAYREQVSLVKEYLSDKFEICENKMIFADITHYHTVNFRYSWVLPLVKSKGKTVGYVHFLPETVETSITLPRFMKRCFYWYLLKFYKAMDKLVVVNPYFTERLADYGVSPEKVTYIPNFVDSENFYPLPEEEKKAMRRKYGIDENVFTVICAGQLQKRKGIFDFVALAESMPDVQFVWAGGFSFGKITNGYEKVKKIVENPPKNLLFTGIVDREEMNGLYNVGDVMLLPSYEELFPMTVLEAMSCGLPIMLRDLPIYENILFDYYLKGNGNEEFSDIIKKLRDDKEFYSAARNNAERGNLFYNKENIAKMWDEFYTDLINEKTHS